MNTGRGHRLGSSHEIAAVQQSTTHNSQQRREREYEQQTQLERLQQQLQGLCQAFNANKPSFSSIKWECLQSLRNSLLNTPEYFICPNDPPYEHSQTYKALSAVNEDGVITIESMLRQHFQQFPQSIKITSFSESDFQGLITHYCIPDGWAIIDVSQSFRSVSFRYSSEVSVVLRGTPGDLILRRDASIKNQPPTKQEELEKNEDLMGFCEAVAKTLIDVLGNFDGEHVMLELKTDSLSSDHFAQLVIEARSFFRPDPSLFDTQPPPQGKLLCCLLHPNKMYRTIASWSNIFTVERWSDAITIVDAGTKRKVFRSRGCCGDKTKFKGL
jgi:hypothetical protein